jgi:LacI family transcriptional regulator
MMAGERPLTGTIAIAPKGIATRRSTEVLAVEDRQIAAALGMIREQACEGLDVPALVKALPISRSSLERRFAQLLGRSPNAEILRVKLDRTKQLLRESDLPLMAIAEKTGFQNQEYLSRVFKKKLGFTPGQFRAQSQQETGQKTIQGGGMVQLAGRPDPRHPLHSQTEKPDGLSKNKQ